MKAEPGKEKPYILLKFGCIKYADFTDNIHARRLHQALNMDNKENIVKVIKAYNGKFFNWWTQDYITKQQAIDYILAYEKPQD